METNYFGMDSFDRTEAAYCVNNTGEVRTRGITIAPQTAKFLDMDGLTTYHNLSQEQIKKLEERIIALERKVFPVSSAFVRGRLKRADLNLVFNWD